MAPTASKDGPEDDPLPPEHPFTTTVYTVAPSQSLSMAYPSGFLTNTAFLSSAIANGYISSSVNPDGSTVLLYSGVPLTTQTASPSTIAKSQSPQPTDIAESTQPQSEGSLPSPTPGSSYQSPPDKPWEQKPHGPPVTFIAMGILIPALLILSALALFFWYRRHKRNQMANEANIASVMPTSQRKGPQPNMVQTAMPYIHTPRAPTAAAAAAVPSQSPTVASQTSNPEQPVILTTTMNNTYYTGIDTSDHISLTDQRSQTSAESIHGEEPPPPYRPRSVPPISRETSLRQAVLGRNSSVRSGRHDPMSGAGLIRRSDEVRSPFDDPESSDDDALSQISTIRSYPHHQSDRLSVVSDMSDDEHPQSAHNAV